MTPSATRFDAFSLFFHSSFLSQVTTGCDPESIPRVISVHWEYDGMFLAFRSCDGRKGEEPNRVPGVSCG
jgi:hypothetical protein